MDPAVGDLPDESTADSVICAMDPVIPPHPPNVHPIPSDGRRHAGPIEQILHRHWPPGTLPNQQLITAVDRLAGLPSHLAGRLVAGLTAIHVGAGTVTDYTAFADLHDQPVNPARPHGAKWQHIPAAYRDGVIVIGSGGSPLTRDLTMHEVGHALDDLWQPGLPGTALRLQPGPGR